MTESDEWGFARGPEAAREAAADPFWSTVVRRHRDVDVVILPPEEPPAVEVPSDEPEVDADSTRELLRGQLAGLWSALGLTAEPGHLDDVWFAGAAEGTLRWQGTATFDDVDPVVAAGALRRAQELLAASDGWHTLVPPDGIPRVLAGRPGRLGRDEMQVLLASSSRVVVRRRAEPVFVGADAAARVLAGER